VNGQNIDANIHQHQYCVISKGDRNTLEGSQEMQDTSGVHVWLVLAKAFHALAVRAEGSLKLSEAGLGDSDFRVLEALLSKGPLPVNTIGPKVWLTPGSISVAIDRLEKKKLVKRQTTDDRRVRLVKLTAKGRALVAKTFERHAAAMEKSNTLSKEERANLLLLLKKLGKGGDGTP
jgi:MarR family 2-MHQ and catechol resistance regulon transcriptional repressor